MGNRNIVAIIIIIAGLVIIIGLVWFLFLAPVPAPNTTTTVPDIATTTSAVSLPIATTPQPATVRTIAPPPESSEANVRRLAANVVERYGTYSNQSGYTNLQDLRLFMSQAFAARSQQTIKRAQAVAADASLYYAITTKAVTTDTVQFNKTTGRGTFRIQTQRRELVGGPDNGRSFRQTAMVTMVKEGGVWKVDDIQWEE